MAKAFHRLAKQVGERRALTRRPDFGGRIYNIEVMLYELNAYFIRVLHSDIPEGGDADLHLSEADKGFLEAAEDFRKHLELVLDRKRGHNGS